MNKAYFSTASIVLRSHTSAISGDTSVYKWKNKRICVLFVDVLMVATIFIYFYITIAFCSCIFINI